MNYYFLRRRGVMLVLSSPSGAGKSTIGKALLEGDDNISLSVSVTTRKIRPGEKDGREYHFINEEQFHAMKNNGELLEYAEVFGHFYGTPKAKVVEQLQKGKDVLFDIDWQGTQQLAESSSSDVVRVFILPPSIDALEERLYNRAQDTNEIIKARMAKAADEMSHWPEYDWVIVNANFAEAVQQVKAILTSERLRRSRQQGVSDFVNRLINNSKSEIL